MTERSQQPTGASTPEPTTDEVRRFTARFQSPAAAITAIAKTCGVAVTAIDRSRFARTAGRPLTDAEWELIVPHLDDYDEVLAQSGTHDLLYEWRVRVLESADVFVAGDQRPVDLTPDLAAEADMVDMAAAAGATWPEIQAALVAGRDLAEYAAARREGADHQTALHGWPTDGQPETSHPADKELPR
jgi:hypothetical protein